MKKTTVRRHPPRRQANPWAIRLVHHRHTLKVVHHHHTSYPLLFLLLIITGVFSLGISSAAQGVDFTVSGVVPAEKLTQAASISSPVNGATTPRGELKMAGSCQPSSYVKIYRDIDVVGVALCQANGTWRRTVTLKPGDNQLTARTFNITDMEGPRSAAILVKYTGGAGDQTLNMTSDYAYQALSAGEDVTQDVTVSGGTSPYALSFDWGDGNNKLQSQATGGTISASHNYEKAGPDNMGYTVTVTATDAKGREAKMELVAAVLGEGVVPAAATEKNTNYLGMATPAYVVTLIALVSFWLGERREIALMRHRASFRQPARLVPNR